MTGGQQRRRKRAVFLIYDGRARGNAGTQTAICIGVEDSLPTAREMANTFGDAAIYRFDVIGSKLTNEHWMEDSDG